MPLSMAAVMRQIRNWFECEKYQGEIAIRDGVMTPALRSPYLVIRGSAGYDGLHPNGLLPADRPDETFTGVVWGLRPPRDFIALCREIEAYQKQHPTGAFRSETFGDYQYTRESGEAGGWAAAFASQLAPYRRMFTEVEG